MTSQIYINNRLNLIKKLADADVIFIAGNGQISRSGDTAYKFRQDSNLLYLSGLNISQASLLIDVKLNKSFIVAPKISKIEEVFEGVANWPELIAQAGVNDVITEQQALQFIKSSKNLYFNVPPKQLDHGVYSNPNRARWLKRIKRLNINPKDARPALAELRMIKQPYEIENIKQAINITNQTLNKITDKIHSYKTEQEIANSITAEFALQHVEHAYLPIVASGKNASVLHHSPGTNIIQNNTCLLFDVGAEYNNYASDISRTLVIGNNILIDGIIADIKTAQQELIKNIKPGLSWKQLQEKSKELLASVILKNNLGKKDTVDIMFPHAIGHFVGLDTHDAGNYQLPLQQNMVITVEPGLYDAKSGFGVRIEDEVLITADGAIILE